MQHSKLGVDDAQSLATAMSQWCSPSIVTQESFTSCASFLCVLPATCTMISRCRHHMKDRALPSRYHMTSSLHQDCRYPSKCVCEVGTVSKISDCQPEGPGFKPRPGRGLNFRRLSFATPSVDRDVKPLV